MVKSKLLQFKKFLEKKESKNQQEEEILKKELFERHLRILEMKLEKEFKEQPSEYIREMAKAILEFAEKHQSEEINQVSSYNK